MWKVFYVSFCAILQRLLPPTMPLRALYTGFLALSFCFLSTLPNARAQDLTSVAGAPAAAMANTMLTDTNTWAATNNPAGLAWNSKASIALAYRNAFLVENLGTRSIAGVLPFGNSAFGINIQSFGYQQYLSNRLGLAYGLRLGEKTSIGAQIYYHSLTLDEMYGSTRFWTIGLGARFNASKKLTLGAHVLNANEAALTDYQSERTPARLAAGMAYAWSAKLRMTAEVQQVSGQQGGMRAGLEYAPVQNLVLRCGGGTGPALFSFGFGWRVKFLDIDVATHYHNVLGFSPQVSIAWIQGRK